MNKSLILCIKDLWVNLSRNKGDIQIKLKELVLLKDASNVTLDKELAGIGDTLKSKYQYALAILAYSAIRNTEGFSNLDRNIGECQMKLRNYPTAIEHFEKEYKRSSNPEMLLNIAGLYSKTKPEVALWYYEKYSFASPGASFKIGVLKNTLVKVYLGKLTENSQLKSEISKLKSEIAKRDKRIEELKIEIEAAPGGKLFQQAQEHFESTS